MVEVVSEGSLNKDIRETKTSRKFPEEEYSRILSAVKNAPDSALNKPGGLDRHMANVLTGYHFEHDSASGRNSECKLWAPEFDYSVDLYHTDERIAVEVEKSQQKRISDDILKFIEVGRHDETIAVKLNSGVWLFP